MYPAQPLWLGTSSTEHKDTDEILADPQTFSVDVDPEMMEPCRSDLARCRQDDWEANCTFASKFAWRALFRSCLSFRPHRPSSHQTSLHSQERPDLCRHPRTRACQGVEAYLRYTSGPPRRRFTAGPLRHGRLAWLLASCTEAKVAGHIRDGKAQRLFVRCLIQRSVDQVMVILVATHGDVLRTSASAFWHR